ncbi:hypothetical protein HanRHA438_Chr14g0662241 [Helianthus annuus]|uniref:Uncharacterized protein n=1 Tax=Helianthus annuus TaxID=4232 RepID=A0A9K3H7A6_HELAN|nr:hypothetical protein HanXRQr2_Chr14g0651521 [Helianthus annuus]KAJ0469334.1 hypothetical protein HanIR_Chr14g0706771 [Helianthus annuus]KAJ0840959.1 hypothetical protein HanPSC8_Chr14g0624951 [Helianthus annuus]KAJ0854406.1 hypothetical protein HanRHA438_Chr14g0662241 [Helianthus annuus]
MLNPILSRGAYSHDFRFLFCLNLRDMMFLILEDREEHKIGFRLPANDNRVRRFLASTRSSSFIPHRQHNKIKPISISKAKKTFI